MAQHEIVTRAFYCSHYGMKECDPGRPTQLEQIFRTRTTGKHIGGTNRACGEFGGYGSRFAPSVTLNDLLNAPWEQEFIDYQYQMFSTPLAGNLGWLNIAQFGDEELVSIMLVGGRGWCVTVDSWEKHQSQTTTTVTLITRKSIQPIDEDKNIWVVDVFPGEYSLLKGVDDDDGWAQKHLIQLNSELYQMPEGKKLTIAEARLLGFDRVYLKEQ
jgi:hypothetical protein